MGRFLVFLLPLLLALGLGYTAGALRKRRAVSSTYGEVQPVLTSLRRLIDTDPVLNPNEYLLYRSEAYLTLANYERAVRAL